MNDFYEGKHKFYVGKDILVYVWTSSAKNYIFRNYLLGSDMFTIINNQQEIQKKGSPK